jgi:hypothetical protein
LVSKVKQYMKLNWRYLREAEELLAKGDHSQASEKFWGAAAEIVKAVATKKRVKTRIHADLWRVVERLDKERPDLELVHDFYMANHLHSNFYEDDLTPRAVEEGAKAVRSFVKKMEELLET